MHRNAEEQHISEFTLATHRAREAYQLAQKGDCDGAFARFVEAVAGHHAANAVANVPPLSWGGRDTPLQEAQSRSWTAMQLADGRIRRSCLRSR